MHVTWYGLSVEQEVFSHDVDCETGAPMRHGPVHLCVSPWRSLLLLLGDKIHSHNLTATQKVSDKYKQTLS